jgi:hypothetical protein
MPNDCWSTIEMIGPYALDAFRHHYADAPLDCCKLITTQPVLKFKLYSRWTPPRNQLLELSSKYGVWIRATYEIEYGWIESGMYIVNQGEVLVDSSYRDRTFEYYNPRTPD